MPRKQELIVLCTLYHIFTWLMFYKNYYYFPSLPKKEIHDMDWKRVLWGESYIVVAFLPLFFFFFFLLLNIDIPHFIALCFIACPRCCIFLKWGQKPSPGKRVQITVLWYSLYHCSLELNLYYLQGRPILFIYLFIKYLWRMF